MIYVIIENGKAVSAVDKHPETGVFESRSDWKTLEEAENRANELGDDYIAIDSGRYVYPRFDIIRKPKVGDKISYAFNGDYYPDGEIVAVSKTLKVVTSSSGNKYYRRKKSAVWKKGGTWSMVRGHINRLNPHF